MIPNMKKMHVSSALVLLGALAATTTTNMVHAQEEITPDSESSMPSTSGASSVEPDEILAYDDNRYAQCPKPVELPSSLVKVSVCGDATYEVELAGEEKVCSGSEEDAPEGTVCPKEGQETTLHCRHEIMSYLTGKKTGTCVAPEDAMCVKLTSGAWGCVFPGNCNQVNQCTANLVSNENYEMNDANETVTGTNGYPVPTDVYQTTVDTTEYNTLVKDDGKDDSSPSNCDLAYDSEMVCKCQTPVPAISNPYKIEVSVCGDATYLVDLDVTPCSGDVDNEPIGNVCPKKGDETELACREEVMSYLTGGKTGTCVAPEDATCEKLNTGAWGCVFPGNCNTRNTCLETLPVTENYETNEDGTTKVGANDYPILTQEAKATGAVTGDSIYYVMLSSASEKEDSSSSSASIIATSMAMTTVTFLMMVTHATL